MRGSPDWLAAPPPVATLDRGPQPACVGNVWIGTASWTEKTLLASRTFYPPSANTAERRLRYYARHFPVVEVSCRYFKPAHYDDIVIIATQLTSVGRAKLNFDYKIAREGDRLPLALGSTKHACVDSGGRITRIPADLAKLLNSV